MIRISKATEDSIWQILKIEQEAISPPWSREALISEIDKDDSYFITAIEGTKEPSSRVVGFALLRQVGDDAELLRIAVDKSVRRSGVGDLLMISVLDYVRKNRIKSLLLEVRSSNTAAVRLYEKHGLTTVRIRKDYYTDPVENAIVMAISY